MRHFLRSGSQSILITEKKIVHFYHTSTTLLFLFQKKKKKEYFFQAIGAVRCRFFIRFKTLHTRGQQVKIQWHMSVNN